MNSITEKKCSKCGEVKAITDFKKDRRNKDGHTTCCLRCDNEWYKEYRANNRDRIHRNNKKWEQNNKDKVYNKLRAWIQNNVERRRETVRKNNAKYRMEHPDKRLINQNNRRARQVGNGGTTTTQEWRELKDKYNHMCLCCKRKEPDIVLTMDHVIPIKLGGVNSISNIQPLCKLCNSRKGVKIQDYR